MPVSQIAKAPSVRFAMAARLLSDEARDAGLLVPAFKSPPSLADADRTVKRFGRDIVVAVRIRGRPFGAVIADLIEGVVVCNAMSGLDAGKVRSMLWSALDQDETLAA